MASNSDPDKAPRYLYRKNLFGDVTEIYNQAGELEAKYSYTAFGVCTVEVDKQGITTKIRSVIVGITTTKRVSCII